jgi:hypothetical protein
MILPIAQKGKIVHIGALKGTIIKDPLAGWFESNPAQCLLA